MSSHLTAAFVAVLLIQGGKQGLPYGHDLLDLLKDPSPELRKDAAQRLGKMGADAKAAVPDLLKALTDQHSGVRAAVAAAFGEIGDSARDAAPALAKLLSVDRDVSVRTEAGTALSKIGPKGAKALPDVLKSLKSETDDSVRTAIAEAAVRMGPQSKDTLAALTELLGDARPETRAVAATALGRMASFAKPALPALSKLESDSNAAVVEAVQLAQQRIYGEADDGDPTPESVAKLELPEWKAFTIANLAEFLKSPTPSTRQKACLQIAKRKAELGAQAKAITGSVAALSKGDPEKAVRAAATYALGEIGNDCQELTKALSDAEASVRIAAANAVGSLGRRAGANSVKALAAARVSDGIAVVRRRAGEALRTIDAALTEAVTSAKEGPERKAAETAATALLAGVVKAFVEGLASPSEDVRMRATLGLGELGPIAKEAVPALSKLLTDEFSYVRGAAAGTLASIGPDAAKNAVPALKTALTDSDGKVRKRVREALVRLDPGSAPVAAAEPPKPTPAPGEAPSGTGPGYGAQPPTPSQPGGAAEGTPPTPPVAASAPPPPPPGTLAEAVFKLLDGEGGTTEPTGVVEGDAVLLDLKLAHERFDEDMGWPDAARLSIKVLRNIEKLERISVVIRSNAGRVLSKRIVTRAKAAPFFEKVDDPFEGRRIREWWPLMSERG